VGPFRVEDAEPERVLPLLAALVHLPERRLDDDEARLVRSGRALLGGGEGPIALWVGDGELLAVGQAEGGEIRPETVLG
jgi:tRNA Pseudouridine synthase II, C terminal